MPKVGLLKANLYRHPERGWALKYVTVTKTRSGKYECSIVFKCSVTDPEPVIPRAERMIGIQHSLIHFYADQDMLNRMVSLATQSANGTYDNDVDRANLQKEVNSLKEEINRIADSANFNGIKLLDGSLDVKTHDVTTETGGEKIATGADLILQNETEATEGVGLGTILKKTPLSEGATEFELDLQNLSVQGAKEGDTLTVTLGNQSITLKAEDSPTQVGWDGDPSGSTFIVKTEDLGKTEKIAEAISKAFNEMEKTVPGGSQTGLHIEGEEFKAKYTSGSNKVTFEQQKVDGEIKKTVNPNLDVKIEYSPVGGGASASVANVNVGDASRAASFSVDLTLPATGTTDMEMFGQHFRITDGTDGQSLDGGIASHELATPTGNGSANNPYVITRGADTTDQEILNFIAGKLNAVSVGGKTFSASVSTDGMSLNFTATSTGAVTGEGGAELTAEEFATAINAQVTVSSGSSTSTPNTPGTPSDPATPSDPNTPGTTTPTNPLGTVTATIGSAAGSATAATSTADFSTAINTITDSNAAGGTVTVDGTTYSWGTSSGSGTAITGSSTADLQAALRTALKTAAETNNSGWTGAWGTGDDANKLTLTAGTPGSAATAPTTILGETATVVAGTDAGSATAGTALADLELDNLEGGTLTIGDKSFFFSKYADATAAAAGNDESPAASDTVLYLSDYGSVASLATALNGAANAPTDVTVTVTQGTGKVNIAVSEKSGSEGTLTESQLQGKISFTPKATTSGGGAAAEGIEIVRMSIASHDDTTTTTPSSIAGTANSSIGVGSSTPAVAAVYESTITETTALVAGNQISVGGTTYDVVAAGTTINDGDTKVLVSDVTGVNNLASFIASKLTDSDYTITASGANLVYTANTPGAINGEGPTSAPTLPTITVSAGTDSSTPNVSAGAFTNSTPGTDTVPPTNSLNASTLTSAAIKTAADAVTGITSGNVTIEKNASNKLELKIGSNVIGTSTESVDGTATTFTFKTSDGTALGTVTATTAPAASDFTAALNTGLTYTAATTGTPSTPGTDPVTPGGDDDDTTTDTETTTVPSAKLAVEGIDLGDKTQTLTDANLKAIGEAFEDLGSNGTILVNQDVEVCLKGIAESLSNGNSVEDLMQAVADTAKAAAEAWNAANSSTLGYKYTNIRVSTTPAGDPANDIAGQIAGDGFYILMDQQSIPTAENSSKLIGTYNVNTTQNLQGADKDNDVLASTIITEQKMASIVADGNVLTIGNKSYVFRTEGADSKIQGEDANGMVTVNGKEAKVIDVSDAEVADQAKKAMEILGSKGFVDNDEFTIGYEQDTDDGNRLSIHETKGALANDDPMSEKLKTLDGFNSLITVESYHEVKTEEGKQYHEGAKKLSLQIGDTSDDFNQLQVGIGDMHTTAMFGLKRDKDGNLLRDEEGNTIDNPDSTIDSIRIDSQEAAKNAINTIKDAINYVSSVRGTLGAISNRLDHTANNLSVMAENITDAESTIRDTDIAEEMMAYTKNNILVQSAQANQVPQGVLQLLQ